MLWGSRTACSFSRSSSSRMIVMPSQLAAALHATHRAISSRVATCEGDRSAGMRDGRDCGTDGVDGAGESSPQSSTAKEKRAFLFYKTAPFVSGGSGQGRTRCRAAQ